MMEDEPVTAVFRGSRNDSMHELLQQLKSAYIPNLVIFYEAGHDGPPALSLCGKGTCYPPAGNCTELTKVLSALGIQREKPPAV
jgi:hypothetical protein